MPGRTGNYYVQTSGQPGPQGQPAPHSHTMSSQAPSQAQGYAWGQAQVAAGSGPQHDAVSNTARQQTYRQAAQPQPPSQAPYYAGQSASVETPRKGRGWIVALVIVGLLALMGVAFASCMSSVAKLADLDTAQNNFDDNTVAVIEMGGTIQYDGTENSPEGLKYLLDQAEEDDNVKAVVLRVNSGGGVAAAGEEMSIYLQEFQKPVVVSSAAINASAAYMISAQSDYIYVLNSTDIGSIGTIMQHYDLSELLAKLGVNIENIKSAESKDSSYYNRPLTEEERAEYQHQVDVINDNFIRLVAEGRDMDEDKVRALADGSTKVGRESVEAGLADEVGTFDDACRKAAELAGLDEDDYNTDYLRVYSNDLGSLVGLLGSTGQKGSAGMLLDAIEETGERDALVH